MGKNIKIVVLDRGWVVVGDCKKEGNYFLISEACIIRKWGTTRGLGELAEKGPNDLTLNTFLDPCPSVRVLEKNIIFLMDVNHDNWK